MPDPALNTYRYIVTIKAEDGTNGWQALSERLDFDEDYGFPYTLEWRNVGPDVERVVREALEGDSNDAEHDALVLAAEALGISYNPEGD